VNVGGRTSEFGIRLALGAPITNVLRIVMMQGLRLALAGVFIGWLASLVLTRLMQGVLFGVKANDPLTFLGIAVLLVLVALLACFIPARRATKVDPLVALRSE
jgi:ABC-type antimicrobial peptide transport system permease subunit